MDNNTVLEMKNIHKSFPGVRALKGVDFHLNKGEIHALMGENGAGKSTLIKVLTGVYSKDEGQIFIDGNDKAVSIHSPQEAQKLASVRYIRRLHSAQSVRGGEHVHRTFQ